MKKSRLLFLVFCVLAYVHNANAQVKIGDNPTVIHSKAVLQLDKTDKGFLPPRLTTTQMNALFPTADSSAAGMTIFNITDSCTFIYSGTTWKSLCDPNDFDWFMNSGASNYKYVSNNDSTIYRMGSVVIGSNYNSLNPVENFLLSDPTLRPKLYVNGNGAGGFYHFDTITRQGASYGSFTFINPAIASQSFFGMVGNMNFIGTQNSSLINSRSNSLAIGGSGIISNITNDYLRLDYNSTTSGTVDNIKGRDNSLSLSNYSGIISNLRGDITTLDINSANGTTPNVIGSRTGVTYTQNDGSLVNGVQGGYIGATYKALGQINNLNGLNISTDYNSDGNFGQGDGFAYFHGLMGIYNTMTVSGTAGSINSNLAGTKQELWYSRRDSRTQAFYGTTNRMYVIYPNGSGTVGEPRLGIGYDIQMGPYSNSPGLFVNAIGFLAGNRGRDTSIAYSIRFGQSENASGNGASFGYYVPSGVMYRLSNAKVRAFFNEDVNVKSSFMGSTGIGIDNPLKKLHVADPNQGTTGTSVRLENIPQYANDAAAGLGGLNTGDVYCTLVGGDLVLKIKQ